MMKHQDWFVRFWFVNFFVTPYLFLSSLFLHFSELFTHPCKAGLAVPLISTSVEEKTVLMSFCHSCPPPFSSPPLLHPSHSLLPVIKHLFIQCPLRIKYSSTIALKFLIMAHSTVIFTSKPSVHTPLPSPLLSSLSHLDWRCHCICSQDSAHQCLISPPAILTQLRSRNHTLFFKLPG